MIMLISDASHSPFSDYMKEGKSRDQFITDRQMARSRIYFQQKVLLFTVRYIPKFHVTIWHDLSSLSSEGYCIL